MRSASSHVEQGSEERHVYRGWRSRSPADHLADLPTRVDEPRVTGPAFAWSDAAAEGLDVRDEAAGLGVEAVLSHGCRALVVRADGEADVAFELAEEMVEVGHADADVPVRRALDAKTDDEDLDEVARRGDHLHPSDGVHRRAHVRLKACLLPGERAREVRAHAVVGCPSVDR